MADGTGVVSLDVQFLPDVNIQCPDCHGSRYSSIAYDVKLTNKVGESASLPELMDMDVNTAVEFCKDIYIRKKLYVKTDNTCTVKPEQRKEPVLYEKSLAL